MVRLSLRGNFFHNKQKHKKMHFEGKTVFNVVIGVIIGLAIYTLVAETPVRKLAEKIPFNK